MNSFFALKTPLIVVWKRLIEGLVYLAASLCRFDNVSKYGSTPNSFSFFAKQFIYLLKVVKVE